MDMFEDFAVDFGKFETTAAHDSGCNLHESVDRDVGEACFGATILEAWDELAGEPGTMEIDTYSDYGSGVEHTVDAGFGVVSHDKAAELEVSTHEALLGIIPDADLGIVVFEIAGIGAGADVTPLPYHGITEITVMCLIAETEDDGIVDFATHLAERSEGRTTINFGTHSDFGIIAECERSAEARSLHDMSISTDIDRAIFEIDGIGFNDSPLLDKESRHTIGEFGIADDTSSGVWCDTLAMESKPYEIVDDLLGIISEDIEDIIDATGIVGALLAEIGGKSFELTTETAESPDAATITEGVSRLKERSLEGSSHIGEFISGDKEGFLLLVAIQGKLLAEILLGIERILTGEEMLPLFGDGKNTDAESRHGAGIREREEISRIVDGIKKNNFHRDRGLTVRRN